MKNVVGWFEIPVKDMDRAIKFYEDVFGHKLERMKLPNIEMALFPINEEMGSSGALVKNEKFYSPSEKGTLVYFTAFSGDVANELSKVEKASGKIVIPKRKISEEHGNMAIILDTEGNRIAIHSKN